ncbi:MAG: sigma-70 family RNA polymerase sigma factor [Bacteroidales bacterium]|nr:sigma-70 family RNA polymerase sigma factor [Bacteroidales bacterium]
MTEKEYLDIMVPCSRRLFSIAFRILRSREDAEDAVQDTLLKLWKLRSGLEAYKSPEALAVVMVRNTCIDTLRRFRTESIDDNPGRKGITVSVPSPHDIYSQNETLLTIEGILESMPQNYSEILRKRDIEGQDYEEIAKSTDQNINSVRVMVSRARKYLRVELDKLSYEEHRGREFARKIL